MSRSSLRHDHPVTEPGFASLALRDVPKPDFGEVLLFPLEPGHPTDPAQWARSIFSPRRAPRWVQGLFVVREVVVRLLGIPRAPRDVFAVQEVVGEEALIATNDRHLDFRVGVAVDRDAALLRVTTVVRLHGWRGRLYFLPTRLLHPLVLRSMVLRAIGRAGAVRTPAPALA